MGWIQHQPLGTRDQVVEPDSSSLFHAEQRCVAQTAIMADIILRAYLPGRVTAHTDRQRSILFSTSLTIQPSNVLILSRSIGLLRPKFPTPPGARWFCWIANLVRNIRQVSYL